MTEQITYIAKGVDIKPEGEERPSVLMDKAKEDVANLLRLKNVHFLLGAGASHPAIPTMEEMYKELKEAGPLEGCTLWKKMWNDLFSDGIWHNNLEVVLSKLYAIEYVKNALTSSGIPAGAAKLKSHIIEFILSKVRFEDYPCGKCKYIKTLERYKEFYRRAAFRNRDVARLNVFTTNYDLFTERALDSLNINYNNGFGGGLRRFFNSARFHHTLSQKLDVSTEKYEPVDNMAYLYKLHGSINWSKAKGESLEVEEHSGDSRPDAEHVLIYPSPLKEGYTLAAPYSDLMREFKTKLLLPHSVLFVIGYGFGDLHINNLIYQAMAVNTSLSLFVFGEPSEKAPLDDGRFFCLYGKRDEKDVHFFDYIVNEILPKEDDDDEQKMKDHFKAWLKKECLQYKQEPS